MNSGSGFGCPSLLQARPDGHVVATFQQLTSCALYRFKAKSKSGGDVKGSSKVEPYAYWPLDRKMLNRRSAKQTTAKRGLDQVVNAAKVGAGKGRKSKRQRTL